MNYLWRLVFQNANGDELIVLFSTKNDPSIYKDINDGYFPTVEGYVLKAIIRLGTSNITIVE